MESKVIPFETSLRCDERIGIGGGVAGQILGVNALMHRISPEAVEIDIQPPDDVMHVCRQRHAWKVYGSRAEAAKDDAIVPKGPFHDVVVIRRINGAPQHKF